MNNALIFIPDISGFTNFVNTTPVEHSRHIISELLEIIIKANTLDMTVSEIEGDAVLFYREGPAPSLEEVLEQTRKIFIEVHTHLKRYESLRICNCDACSSASGLGIKFMVHYGEVGFIEVLGTRKPHGKALILAHRILKNSIPSREYLLLTKDYCDQNPGGKEMPTWATTPQKSFEEYDVGKVEYEYLLLEKLLSEVPNAPLPLLPEHSETPLVVEGAIDAALDRVFDMVTDLDKRSLWNPQVKILEHDPGTVNRAGNNHRCLIGSQEVMVETTKLDLTRLELAKGEEEKVRTFGERVSKVPILGNLSLYYILKQENEKTNIRLEVHFPEASFLKGILIFFMKKRFRKNLSESIVRLREQFA